MRRLRASGWPGAATMTSGLVANGSATVSQLARWPAHDDEVDVVGGEALDHLLAVADREAAR